MKINGMSISPTELVISVTFAVLMGGTLAYLFWKKRKQAGQLMTALPKKKVNESVLALQLQAYERLTLLAERIALPNLISRTHQPHATLKEMEALLTQQIRSEFEHNITQQIYVSGEAWEAVRNLIDQHLLIIHQVASYLPPPSTGADLNKAILEMVLNHPNASLHQVVSEVLRFEAKKLMQQTEA